MSLQNCYENVGDVNNRPEIFRPVCFKDLFACYFTLPNQIIYDITKGLRSPHQVQAENTNLSESIIVQLTSCLFCMDSAALLMFSQQQLYLFVESKPVKQDVSHTVILPPVVSVLQVQVYKSEQVNVEIIHLFRVLVFT